MGTPPAPRSRAYQERAAGRGEPSDAAVGEVDKVVRAQMLAGLGDTIEFVVAEVLVPVLLAADLGECAGQLSGADREVLDDAGLLLGQVEASATDATVGAAAVGGDWWAPAMARDLATHLQRAAWNWSRAGSPDVPPGWWDDLVSSCGDHVSVGMYTMAKVGGELGLGGTVGALACALVERGLEVGDAVALARTAVQ